MHVSALLSMYVGTHPLLTAPPTSYPVIKAAENICEKRRKYLRMA
jgi:NADH oxidase (H2O2-forming)